MGSKTSQLVEVEKLNWSTNHSLQIDVNLRDEQIPLLNKFADRLHLCSQNRFLMGMQYCHYFITDKCWTLEFGVGEVMSNCVIIHNNPKGEYEVEKSVGKTPTMVARMQKVCGARGYCLCLRNCEHVARYVLSGSWISMQTVAGSSISKKVITYMVQDHKSKINTLPIELVPAQEMNVLYPDQRSYLNYTGSPEALYKSDKSAFNVLVIGPTGCGKSRLINHFYNQTVCRSAPSATSVTKHIQITTGMGMILGCQRRINVIDTIGFCDSTLSKSEVHDIIKNKVRDNVMYLDRVIIICSGRVEGIHVENIRQIMTWLKFDDHRHSFTFVYNKADLLDEAQRESNLMEMCGMLETGNHTYNGRDHPLKWIPSIVLSEQEVGEETTTYVKSLKVTSGFPENASYNDIERDLHEILDNAFCSARDEDRLAVDSSWCPIL